MTVLLVWEEVPENISFYLLEGEAAQKAISAHGCYINMVDGDPNGAAEQLNEILPDLIPLDKSKPIPTTGIGYVVYAGFLM